jgi:molybdenum cofactor cytidylyltransferase
MTGSDIGIIVLAAGRARRFGKDKRKASMNNGHTLLDNSLANIPSSFTRRILVLREDDSDIAANHPGWQICHADNPDSGMANSLASGIRLTSEWSGALITLADMPFIQSTTYEAIQAALSEHEIVIPCCNGKRGNPVGFRQSYFQEIAGLTGDRGARSLLGKYEKVCFDLETGDEGVILDIDTPEGLE